MSNKIRKNFQKNLLPLTKVRGSFRDFFLTRKFFRMFGNDLTLKGEVFNIPNIKRSFEYFPESSRGKMINIVLLIFALLLLIAATFLAVSLLYLNIPGKPIELNAIISNIPQLKNSGFSNVIQFYPNMKFNHNNITYKVDLNCPNDKKTRMIKAFEMLSRDVSWINFSEEYEGTEADIDVSCSENEKYNLDTSEKKHEFFIAGEGGARKITQTERYNIINKGVILLYENLQNSVQCDWPNTEVHELMHVFGFSHSIDKNSLMYPYLKSCDQKLDNSIIRELNRIYSGLNLADLYFENVSAIKKGRYLDFNVTIKNSGNIDAFKVSYSVLDDSEIIETKELKDLKYGTGIIIRVSNLKLNKRNSKEIKIIIDYFNKTNEIDKENNIASFKFN